MDLTSSGLELEPGLRRRLGKVWVEFAVAALQRSGRRLRGSGYVAK